MNRSRLPININDLLNPNVVESDRIEFKEGWNPDAVLRSICAFANDFHNLGGGYIVLGVEAVDGQPQLPPKGVPASKIDPIQQDLLRCCNLLQPMYFPVFSVEELQGKQVIVLWVPGGHNRPYKAPKEVTAKHKEYHYYIRQYSSSVIPKREQEQELISLAANVPFDDRTHQRAELTDLKLPLIQAFLKEVGSSLHADAARMPFQDLCLQMRIADGGMEVLRPLNAGLLFFSENPERFFPGARIELVEFPKGVDGGELDEKYFRGPLHQQIRNALAYLEHNIFKKRTIKLPDRAEARQIVNYPFAAIEEALVNAVYHRGYDLNEPIEVRINPDCIEILSLPGPVPEVDMRKLKQDRVVARRYRNRRVGEFLKELKLTEGRGTGIPDIRRSLKDNGSPSPEFETDADRTYFLSRIPIHPAWLEAPARKLLEIFNSLSETEIKILGLLKTEPLRSIEIAQQFGYSRLPGGIQRYLEGLERLDLIAMTIPDKPKSRNQRRMLTEKGVQVLEAGRTAAHPE